MLLKHSDFIIRDAVDTDAQTLCAWWNDGDIMAHAGFPKGLNTSPEHIRAELKGDSDESGRRLIIEKEGRPIGEMNYKNKGNNIAEIGIKICDFSIQNNGSGKVLLSMLIRTLFSCGYHTITLDTNLDNTRAQHVYERLGFRKIRVNIDSWTDQLGKKQSSVDYELTEHNFISFV